MEGEERAWCNYCKTDIGCNVTRFKDHQNTFIHKKNAELVRKGSTDGFIEFKKKGRIPNKLKESRMNIPKNRRIERFKDYKDRDKKDKEKEPPKAVMHTIFDDYTPPPSSTDQQQQQATTTVVDDEQPGPIVVDATSDYTTTITSSEEATTIENTTTITTTQHPNEVTTVSAATVEQVTEYSTQLVNSLDLRGMQVHVLAEGEGTIHLDPNMKILPIDSQVLMELPVIPMCTLKANAQHPNWYQQMMSYALSTGVGYDAVWQCEGALFRVHKFVLAAFSTELYNILPDNEEEVRIFTPDLSRDMVEAMLLTMYTGQAVISWKLLQEINNGFKVIGFTGKDLSAYPYDNSTCLPDVQISYSAAKNQLARQEFTPIKLLPERMRSAGRQAALLTPGELEDPGELLDLDYDPHEEPRTASLDQLIKIEVEDNEPVDDKKDLDFILNEPMRARKRKIKPNTQYANYDWNMKRIKKDLDILMDKPEVPANVVNQTKAKNLPIKKEKPDARETRTTYPICKKNGVLSRKLAFDLIDDKDIAAQVKVISICPCCFQLFDDKEKMNEHRIAFHDDDGKTSREWNSMIEGKTKFNCKKCKKTLELQHLVWFVKHYKFCGVDDEKANEILRIGQQEDQLLPPDEFNQVIKKIKAHPTDVDVLHVMERPRRKEMAKVLLGKEVASIWGCRKCYQAFDSEAVFKAHIKNSHDGKIEHGTNYDAENKEYFCKNCNIFKTNKTVISYIYHKATCNVNAKGAVNLDDEDGEDEDTYDEFVDPWGVVYKPLKVTSKRANWICEALFNEIVDIIYPCHLCYTPFKSEEEIREHFRAKHPERQNCLEDGKYYSKERKCFNCPHCKLDVCKKQRNSIYFTYHMRKCNGQLYTVNRKCPDCGKNFTSFTAMQHHIQNKCDTRSSMCHICSMVIKTTQGMKWHMKWVHSDARPFKCNVCTSAYKRSCDLKQHMKMHMGSLDWSCEKCGKSFTLKKHLRAHLMTHMSDHEKPHVCHLCGHRFTHKKYLVDHIATHSSFRGFRCEVCNTTVKTRTTLMHHRNKVHKLGAPLPEECIIQPEPGSLEALGLGMIKPVNKPKRAKRTKLLPDLLGEELSVVHTSPVQIKEEMLPELGEELELA